MSILRTNDPVLLEVIDLENSSIFVLSQTTWFRVLTLLLGYLTVMLTVLFFLSYLYLFTIVIVLQWPFLHWGILIVLFPQFLLIFPLNRKGVLLIPPSWCMCISLIKSIFSSFIHLHITVLLFLSYLYLLSIVIVLQWPFLHWGILILLFSPFLLIFPLNQKGVLLIPPSWRICISLIKSIFSSFIHLHISMIFSYLCYAITQKNHFFRLYQ